MRETQNVLPSDWGDGFLFVANSLALDFLNTRPVQNGTPVELLSDFKALVRWFQAAGLVGSREARDLAGKWAESAKARRVVEQIQEFREQLRGEVLWWEDGNTPHQEVIEQINALLWGHPMRSKLKLTGPNVSIQNWFPIDTPEDLLAPLSQSAANLFALAERRRVHKCANADCVLHFRDTSKKGTRRWCSMRSCGNRQKVAAYAARKRQHD